MTWAIVRSWILPLTVGLAVAASSPRLPAKDYFLTIGGGYSPSGNQASLERNVHFYQRLLSQQQVEPASHTIFFADGDSPGRDLQVIDRDSLPRANQLMAEFFGSRRDLGLYYRNHEVDSVAGATTPDNIRRWFADHRTQMRAGDRLLLYVTSHGSASNDRNASHNTAISLWNNKRFTVQELVALLDTLPTEVQVTTVMVQCHAGGFARFIYRDADPKKGLSEQRRCGFFATVHDRPAAGCTPEINEATYVEYSTYFWEAIGGISRTGETIAIPDYDRNGVVTFDEAHAYTVLTSDTIDLPITTSGEFLGIESLFANEAHPELLADDAAWSEILPLATPAEKAVLEGLSQQLNLDGEDRITAAREKGKERPRSRSGSSRGRQPPPEFAMRQKIATDLKRRWPELGNVLNPVSIELVTSRREEFIQAIEKHQDYKRYCELQDKSTTEDPVKQRVKYERLVRTAENVILRENLKRLNDPERLTQYDALVKAESFCLKPAIP
ncbi:MAG: hypothetical protein KDA96_10430 [Planctomycetaceae bacterium]|nr:hypothetical protein [Planctomycetaceae bacterium]